MRQKLYVKPSIEAEIVALSDKFSDMLWSQYFVESLKLSCENKHMQESLIIYQMPINLV